MIHIVVIGTPATKGSARAFVRGGRTIVTNDCVAEKPWAQNVHWAAREVVQRPMAGPVEVTLLFRMPRVGRLGKKRVGVLHDRKPDLDKLTRSVLDALTGVAWFDDAQVASLMARKFYADPDEVAGVEIELEAMHGEE